MTTTLPAYKGLSDAEKAARIGAEVRLITLAKRAGIESSQHACPLCKGSVSITLKTMSNGTRKGSRGACSNRNCLRWDE
jgi:hypothetical protein